MDKKEYIERGALISILDAKSEMAMGTPKAVFASVSKMVELLPAADVVEARHGEWEIVIGSNGKEKMVCTNCRHQQDLASTFTYCPTCGAKMDGERKEQA